LVQVGAGFHVLFARGRLHRTHCNLKKTLAKNPTLHIYRFSIAFGPRAVNLLKCIVTRTAAAPGRLGLAG
jgi:hypothetical protein